MSKKLIIVGMVLTFCAGFLSAQTAVAPELGDGSESTPYQIATLENLYWIAASDDEVSSPNQATRWSSCYKQVNDIDASSTSTWNPDGSGGYEGWEPIGYYDYDISELYPFTGIYDGGNYNITGLFINRPNTNEMALFGVIIEAQIKNLGLMDVNIKGFDDVAGLIGVGLNATVTNCFTTGEVAGNNYSSGGLIGYFEDGSITNCNSSVNVTGNWEVGGLIGSYYVQSEAEIHHCYSSGNIVGTEEIVGGLIGSNQAIMTNCYSTGSVTGGANYTGGLIGYNDLATISNCYSTANVEGVNTVGGLIGNNVESSISNCYSTSNVQGVDEIGGFIGSQPYNDSDITDCYSTGNVIGDEWIGGFGGSCDGNISNCYSTGNVTGNTDVNGFLGFKDASGTVNNCFWDIETSGLGESGDNNYGATGKTTDEMQTQSTFTGTGWDFTDIWGMDSEINDGYPYLLSNVPDTPLPITAEAPSVGNGSVGNPYQITTLANLRWLSENADEWVTGIYFIQTADIDASVTQGWNDGAGFSPIGNISNHFMGNYDGGGKTISGLYIYRPSSDIQGLFGYMGLDAEISNLGLIDVDIGGGSGVGGLIGSNDGTVSNCYASGTVNGADYVGGLIGINYGTGTISNCYSNGTVSGTQEVGGLIGRNRGNVSNCYASGSVSGTQKVGGLIGYNRGTISNCYSSGAVGGETDVGGFLGFYVSGTITACFWDTETSGQTTSAGGTGKTTTEMQTQSTYTNWDFVEVWGKDSEINDGYPYLLSNVPDTPLPIALSAFSAVYANGSVKVTWVTESETENLAFRIYRDNEMIAELEGAGTTSEPQDYCYTDNHVIPGKTYTYFLADVTIGNQEVRHSDKAITITAGEGNVAKDYSIGVSYPNPFNPSCIVPLNLAASAEVNAVLYDLNGRLVKELHNGALSAGSHDLQIDGTSLATGIYLVKIQINDALHVRKVALMK